MIVRNTRPNPYVGPRSFRTGEKLYGRDQEVNELLNLLIAERIVLLHSPSGAGKSSIVQAGLIPRLQEDGFQVLPVARVNQEPAASLRNKPNFNRYVFSVLMSLDEAMPEDQRIPVDDLAGMNLTDYLTNLQIRLKGDQDSEESQQTPAQAIVLDQFEEILTIDPTDREEKTAFFVHIGQALRDRNRWALFSMRDDYVASLNPYIRPVPTRFANTYRLDLLGVQAARQAVSLPASNAGVNFNDAAVDDLINDLRKVQVQQADGTMETQPGQYVEPVQLQVVCYRLWQNLAADDTEITTEDLTRTGDVNHSLAEYYAERIAAAAETTGVSERIIRDWFEHHLITESGIRGQVLMGVDRSEGLENTAIRLVVDAHLVRSEKRRGVTWFELAHDRLLEPVKTSNDEWSKKNLSQLQRQATVWNKQNRADHLLLRLKDLEDAEAWAAAHPDELTEVDRDFLADCLDVRRHEEEKLEAARQLAQAEWRRAEEQALSAKKIRARFFMALIAALAALVFAGMAFVSGNQARQASEANKALADTNKNLAEVAQTQEAIAIGNAKTAEANAQLAEAQRATAVAAGAIAQTARADAMNQQATAEYNFELAVEQARLARSRELAGLAIGYVENESDLALLLGIEAYRMADTGGAMNALLSAVQRKLSREIQRLDQKIPSQPISIYTMAASPDGRKLAWGGAGGLLRVWDFSVKNYWEQFTEGSKEVNALSFSPDGKILATGDSSATIIFWDTETGRKLRVIHPQLVSIQSLSFSPDGSKLAYAGTARGSDVNLFVKNLNNSIFTGFSIRPFKAPISSIAWSPDNKLLVSGGEDRVIRFWDAETGKELQKFSSFDGNINSLAFSPNGQSLAAGADDKTSPFDKNITLWDVTLCQKPGESQDANPWEALTCKQQNPVSFNGQEGDITSLAFSPDGQILATGDTKGTTRLWDVRYQELLDQQPEPATQAVTAVTFSQSTDQLLLAVSSTDRTISLSNLRSPDNLYDLTARVDGTAASLSVASNSDLSVLANTPGGVSIWKGATPGEITLDFQIPVTTSLSAISRDGSSIAIVQQDSQKEWIAVYDAATKNIVNQIAAPEGVAITVNDQAGNTITKTLKTSIGTVTALAYNFEGDKIAAGVCLVRDTVLNLCSNNEIYIWDPASGEVVSNYPSDHTGAVISLAFDPTGGLLASGGRDAVIYLSDITGMGRTLGLPLVGQGGPVTSLSFNHDTRRLVSGGANGLLVLWDVLSQQQIANPLSGFQGTVTSLAFYPDDRSIVAGGETGTLAWWRLDTWIGLACRYAGGNLSFAEWETFFKGEEYRQTCPE